MTVSQGTTDLLRHLASRPGHDEVKADFRQLLVEDFGVELGALEFERRVPEVRGRLDALIGRTVFEAKSDLDREWQDVERRMPDYLADREREEKEHFVGVASDGQRWAVFELDLGKLVTVKRTTLDPERPDEFLAWLDGAVALRSSLPPDPLTIRAELGKDSISYRRVNAQLRALWAKLEENPDVSAETPTLGGTPQARLWARGRERGAVVPAYVSGDRGEMHRARRDGHARGRSEKAPLRRGFHVERHQRRGRERLLRLGVADAEGEALVRRIMNHVRRFRLAEVESDVLKILYEVADRSRRAPKLGEYYTPDWLAAKMVRRAVDRPMETARARSRLRFRDVPVSRDPQFSQGGRGRRHGRRGCGPPRCALSIAGTDIHPVAVIIARVTYLLALAPALASRSRRAVDPGLSRRCLAALDLRIHGGQGADDPRAAVAGGDGKSGEKDANGRDQLDFPETFCRDPALFDKAIERMRTGSLEGMNATRRSRRRSIALPSSIIVPR